MPAIPVLARVELHLTDDQLQLLRQFIEVSHGSVARCLETEDALDTLIEALDRTAAERAAGLIPI